MSALALSIACVAEGDAERARRVFAALSGGTSERFVLTLDGLLVEYVLRDRPVLSEEDLPVVAVVFTEGASRIEAHAEHDNVMLALSVDDALSCEGLDVKTDEAAPERDGARPFGPWLTHEGTAAHVLLGRELDEAATVRALLRVPGIVMRRLDIVREIVRQARRRGGA